MKIQMLTNGVDSLKTGFKAFLKYEENTVNKTPTQEDYLILKHIFKLKSMIVYFPKVKSSMSPIIVFESDDDDSMNQKYSNYIAEDVDEGRSLSGISFDEENPPRITFDHKEINEFYAKVEYDDTFIVPKYHTIDYYLTHEIFACVNVQGLGYWNFGKFLMRTKGKDGQWVKVNMRQIEK